MTGHRKWARSYIQVDVGLLDNREWATLSLGAAGLWTTLYLLAARAGDHFKDADDLVWLATRQRGSWDIDAYDELKEKGWIQEDDDGVTIAGFDKYQATPARYPSDTPEARAERKRRQRAAEKADAEQETRANAANDREPGDFSRLVPRPK